MKPRDTRARIIAAAHHCIAAYGIRKTSLSAVSARAGVHRQTIYLLFGDREGLLHAVVLDRLADLAARVQGRIDISGSIDEAIIEGTLETLRAARRDAGLMTILHSLHDVAVDHALVGADARIDEQFAAIWKPLFLRAQRDGQIDARRSFRDFSQWLRGVQYLVLMRPELSLPQQRSLLRLFVDPGLRISTVN